VGAPATSQRHHDDRARSGPEADGDGEGPDALAALESMPPPPPRVAPEAVARAALISAIARANASRPGMVELDEPQPPTEPAVSYRTTPELTAARTPRLIVRARAAGASTAVEVFVALVVCVLPLPLLFLTRWLGTVVPVIIEMLLLVTTLVWTIRGTAFELVLEGSEATITWDHPWGRRARVLSGIVHAFVDRPAKDAPVCVVRTIDGEHTLLRASNPRSLAHDLPDLLEWYRVWLRERAAARRQSNDR